jgi:hypothetical protein
VAKVPLADLQQLLNDQREKNRLQQLLQEQRDAAEQARIAEIAKREGAERALAEQKTLYDAKVAEWQQKYNDLTGSLHAEKKAAVIAENLTGYDYTSPEAASDVRLILERELETAIDAAGNVTVRQRGTGRPAADFIKDIMATPRMGHFIRAASRGGTPAQHAAAAAAAQVPLAAAGPIPGTVKPSNPGEEAYALWWQQMQEAKAKGYGSIGLTLPAVPASGIGPGRAPAGGMH